MYQDTTRTFADAGARQSVTGSSAAFALPTLGTSREVRIVTSTRTFLRFGTSSGVTVAVDGNALPLPQDCPEVIRVPQGMTHFAVIRESGGTDGAITLTPVA